MDLKPVRLQKIAVSGLLQDSEAMEYGIVQLSVTIGNCKRQITTVMMDCAVASINVPGLSATRRILKRKGVKLADRKISQDLITDIGLTIGSDYYADYVNGVVKLHSIRLCLTSGGHIIFGPLRRQ